MWRPEDRKRLILVMGLLSLVLLVMPSASAKFTGQHAFKAGSEVQCTKCHADIASELNTGAGKAHHNWNGTNASIVDEECRACHIPNLGAPYNNVYGGATASYHAAALIECTYCHSDNNGTTVKYVSKTIPAANVTAELLGSNAAHTALLKVFEADKPGADYLKGANEACLACHSDAGNATIIGEAVSFEIIAKLVNASAGNCTVTNLCYPSTYNGSNTFGWKFSLKINGTLQYP